MNQPLKRFGLWAAGILAVCLLLEGVLFQADALRSRGRAPIALNVSAAQFERREIEAAQDDITAVMPSSREAAPTIRTEILFEEMTLDDVLGAALDFTGDHQLITVQVALRDDAYSQGFASADTLLALPGRQAHARLEPNGTLRALKISFETEDTTAALTGVTLNAPVPYRFSLLRFGCLLLPALFIAAACCFGWGQIILDRRSAAHRAAYIAAALVCAGLVAATALLCVPFDSARFPYTRALEYPFEKSVYQYRSLTHAVMYDMVAKGRLSIDAQPDEALLALENPYDPTARLASGAQVMFDYALYDGAYYSYFGLTPVLLFYTPYRLLTGHLPAYTTAACFFALLTVAAAFLCVWEAVRRWVRRPPLLVVCLGAAAVALGSNVLMILACADRYHLAIAAMQAFFFLTLWLTLLALRQRSKGRRSLAFALAGLSAVLLVGCRATGALAAAGWVMPLLIVYLLDKKQAAKQKAVDALSFLAPLLLGAAVIMVYNQLRFGSPFEFGQRWQLTLEDIHYNRLRLSDLPQVIWRYYLQGLRVTAEFPWFSPDGAFTNRTGNFFYGVANAGALTMPAAWGALLLAALPEKRRRGKLAVYLCAALTTLIVAAAGYAYAGAAHRYTCDILPTLCLIGMLTLTDLCAAGSRRARALACSLFAATAVIAICLIFGNYRGFIRQYNPAAYLRLYQLFSIR